MDEMRYLPAISIYGYVEPPTSDLNIWLAKGTKGKWRYASSKAEVPKGNGDMQAEKPTKGKWRYASSNRDIQVAKRD